MLLIINDIYFQIFLFSFFLFYLIINYFSDIYIYFLLIKFYFMIFKLLYESINSSNICLLIKIKYLK